MVKVIYNTMKSFMKKLTHAFTTCLLAASAIILVGLQLHVFGWILVGIGLASLLFCERNFAKDMLLLYICMIILGVTPISTDISYLHIAQMGGALALTIIIPYVTSRFIYKDYLVRFRFHHGRSWYKTEILYIAVTALCAYIVLPFYLRNTGAYRNWGVDLGTVNLIRFFIGVQILGLWDELFFISTTLGIVRRYMNFHLANITQAVIMTSFLYELGFKGWGFLLIFLFSLVQGYVFRKTESLFYVITIHLTIDLILFMALVHAHYPTWFPLFFT